MEIRKLLVLQNYISYLRQIHRVSPNGTLMIGPKLQDIIPLLIRFRQHAVPLTADVAEVYRHVKVHRKDPEYERIVWREDPTQPIQDYRLLTITYGTAASSWMATRCLQELSHDEKEAFPAARGLLDTWSVVTRRGHWTAKAAERTTREVWAWTEEVVI